MSEGIIDLVQRLKNDDIRYDAASIAIGAIMLHAYIYNTMNKRYKENFINHELVQYFHEREEY